MNAYKTMVVAREILNMEKPLVGYLSESKLMVRVTTTRILVSKVSSTRGQENCGAQKSE